MQTSFRVLAIETSCDETAAAVLSFDAGRLTVLSNVVSSQADLHAAWGGVVPTLAAREHVRNLVPVTGRALAEAGVTRDDIDLIAVTAGPGLVPALVTGVMAAKSLAYAWKKPLLGIHHIEGHIYANLLTSNQMGMDAPVFEFPVLALVVSGGHTELVLMRDHFRYEIVGETQDDAVGEAFDKVAKMLGLPYPGGPPVSERADRGQAEAAMFGLAFPRPLLDDDTLDFSFSGLKTAVLYRLKKDANKVKDDAYVTGVCHAFQAAVLDVLVGKTRLAVERFRPRTFVIAGGVSANTALRARLQEMLAEEFSETRFMTPPFVYSLDNAAMIGAAAAYRWSLASPEERTEGKDRWRTLAVEANLKMAL